MKISELYKKILDISVFEFKAVIESGQILYSQSGEPWKLRLFLYDNSFILFRYILATDSETNLLPMSRSMDVSSFVKHLCSPLVQAFP
jgi:hypothetical protein